MSHADRRNAVRNTLTYIQTVNEMIRLQARSPERMTPREMWHEYLQSLKPERAKRLCWHLDRGMLKDAAVQACETWEHMEDYEQARESRIARAL